MTTAQEIFTRTKQQAGIPRRFVTEQVHISLINIGDTVFHNGEKVTIGRENLKRGGFMGTTICGDSYRMGTLPVTRVFLAAKAA